MGKEMKEKEEKMGQLNAKQEMVFLYLEHIAQKKLDLDKRPAK